MLTHTLGCPRVQVDRFGPTVFEAVNGTGANAVLRAAVANRVDALRYLLQHISAAESVSTQGYTPLHVAGTPTRLGVDAAAAVRAR